MWYFIISVKEKREAESFQAGYQLSYFMKTKWGTHASAFKMLESHLVFHEE